MTDIQEVRMRLVEVAGRTTQDLGLGRIIGQVLADVYLTHEDSSLDDMSERLGLSKAAVSIAARQLETMGLLQRVWKKGDRKGYYRIVENLGVALRQGLIEIMRGKIRSAGSELERAGECLEQAGNGHDSEEIVFLRSRLKRARKLRDRAMQIVDSPIVKMLGK